MVGVVVLAMLIALVSIGTFHPAPRVTDDDRTLASKNDQNPVPPDDPARSASGADDPAPLVAMGITPANVRFAHAASAPVIVGTGGNRKSIRLGEWVPYSHAGSTLHVWNWEQSTESRFFKNVRLWEHDRFAVTPDGTQVVTADGKIFDLETGNHSEIDLGDAYLHKSGEDSLRRIQDMQFSPDGSRLALLVTHIDVTEIDHPLRPRDLARRWVIQIIEFPTARLLCEFPSGDDTRLRIGFSSDGQRVVSNVPQVVERSTTTGEILRKYEPPLHDHAYAFDISPDGRWLAVADGERAILIWDRQTGELKQRIEKDEHHASFIVRFSPDGRYLASREYFLDVAVRETATGKVVAKFDSRMSPADIRWSTDGRRLILISQHGHGGNGLIPMSNVFPAVHEWDWQSGTRVRSLDAGPPRTNE